MSHSNQLNLSTTHPECTRQNCMLRVKGLTGVEECVMDSVRTRWTNPSAVNYCSDPSSCKFINLMHEKDAMQR